MAKIEKTYIFQPSGRDFTAEKSLTPEQRAAALLARMTSANAMKGHVW